MNNKLPDEIIEIAHAVREPVYVVGGFVRNDYLGLSGHTDIDLCGRAGPEAFASSDNLSIKNIHPKLGTFVIVCGQVCCEYTPFRAERYAPDGSHTPQDVTFGVTLEADARRRDFTCNSIYYDIKEKKLLNPLGGIEDIRRKQVRAFDPDFTFSRDGLRTLRTVRFAAELGFSIEKKTEQALLRYAHLLGDISPERKRIELDKLLHADATYGMPYAQYRGLVLLRDLELLQYVIPELKAAQGIPQNKKYHKYDVLEHIFQTVKYARGDIRMAALLHDIGKPDSIGPDGHMTGHHLVSERYARRIMGQSGLKYAKKEIEEVCWLVKHHMYDLKGDVSDSQMKQFVAENIERIDRLAALRAADAQATGYDLPSKNNRFLEFRDRLLQGGAPLTVRDLRINGTVLKEMGIPPGKRSKILRDLLQMCVLNPERNQKDWLIEQAQVLASGGALNRS